MTHDLHIQRVSMAVVGLAMSAAAIAMADGRAVSDRETRPAMAQSGHKPQTVVTAGCLKAADEMDLPADKTHDPSGAPYFVLTNAQPVSPASGGDAIAPGSSFRIIGVSPRMLRARADTQVEITGKVEPAKADTPHPPAKAPASPGAPGTMPPAKDGAAHRLDNSVAVLDGTAPIDSLPAIDAKSIKTVSPRCDGASPR